MASKELQDIFLQLVRLGIGHTESTDNTERIGLSGAEWVKMKALADEQGLTAVVLDTIETLPDNCRPPQLELLNWIGEVLQGEATNKAQNETAEQMAALFHQNAIRTYVLKGTVVAECYPKPSHRFSCDMDCYLVEENQNDNENQNLGNAKNDVWELGNSLVAEKGYEVETIHYKNSTFYFPNLTVENHQFLVPLRGNERLKKLERFFQSQFKEINGLSVQELENSRIGDTYMYRPPVMVSALFLIEHAYSHFLHEGLTWRLVLDWVMFSKKHEKEIAWSDFEASIDEFGFRKFFDVFNAIGMETFGNDSSRIREGLARRPEGESQLENSTSNSQLATDSKLSTVNSKLKSLMLADIWAPLDVHETVRGVKGKLALAGNTWRARWKYRYFTEMSWVTALWIQVEGFLFEKNPKLS